PRDGRASRSSGRARCTGRGGGWGGRTGRSGGRDWAGNVSQRRKQREVGRHTADCLGRGVDRRRHALPRAAIPEKDAVGCRAAIRQDDVDGWIERGRNAAITHGGGGEIEGPTGKRQGTARR